MPALDQFCTVPSPSAWSLASDWSRHITWPEHWLLIGHLIVTQALIGQYYQGEAGDPGQEPPGPPPDHGRLDGARHWPGGVWDCVRPRGVSGGGRERVHLPPDGHGAHAAQHQPARVHGGAEAGVSPGQHRGRQELLIRGQETPGRGQRQRSVGAVSVTSK